MKKILIVDDDEEMCEELSEILRDEGYAVDVMHDGRKGRERLDQMSYDILLLDIKLPGLNGYDILSAVKASKPDIKVIVLSGGALTKNPHEVSHEFDEKEKILKRADVLMNKPYDVAVLIDKIHELARGK
ncbi:MAG: response regulator [Endomicrobiales bacterium]|jgi:DNA-binding response OmpR family regulator